MGFEGQQWGALFVFKLPFLPFKITKLNFFLKNGKITTVEYNSVLQSFTQHSPFMATLPDCNLIAFTL